MLGLESLPFAETMQSISSRTKKKQKIGSICTGLCMLLLPNRCCDDRVNQSPSVALMTLQDLAWRALLPHAASTS